MTKQDLQMLLDYHYWARDRVLAAIETLTPEQFTRDMGNSFRSIRDTAAHIYSADWIWFRRWQGESPTAIIKSETFPDLTSLREAWLTLERHVRAHVSGLDANAIEKVTEYRLLNGQPGASPFWQMLQHVVNHGTYHRGQLTTMLRQIGAAPPRSMDLIAFYRERGDSPQQVS